MKHTAKYLDSGFYTVSDRAAGALVRQAGKPLPRHSCVMGVLLVLRADEIHFATAELQRTPWCPKVHLDAPKRGWVWSLHHIRNREDVFTAPKLGKTFTFSA